MTSIFISQRSNYSSFALSEIYHKLELTYGNEAILSPVNDTPLGLDIRIHVGHYLLPSDVILLIIDENWVDEPVSNKKNIIRLTIEIAIKLNIPIIPVFINEATLSEEISLPSSISSIRFLQGIKIKEGPGLKRDINRLLEGISQLKSINYRQFYVKPGVDLSLQITDKDKDYIWNWLKVPFYAVLALGGCIALGILVCFFVYLMSPWSTIFQIVSGLFLPFAISSGIILAIYILKKD